MTYPDGEALTYSYQDNLLLDGVQSSIDSLNLVSSVSYKDIGLPDSYTLGSSPTTATQSFEYWKIDDTARSPYGALKRTKLTKDSTDLVNREMQYDPVGNVTKTVDSVNSETIDYTYDDLDRLLTASVPSNESFAYNTIGNMTSKSGTTLDYGTTSPKHGVKSYGSTSYSYDANGSMTNKGDLSIKYDPEHRPVRVQDGNTIYRVAYDGDGVRRKRLDENGTVHYLGHYERNVGNGADTTEAVTKYYYATLGTMSRLLAFRRGGTLHWVGSDHLGGTIRVMDSNFAAVDGMRYEPYGEDRDSGDSLNTDRKFTGQTEDQSIGLYWYASRAYDPETGRFCTPDPIVPAPGYPPALNRYSYVYNNPLKYVDPSGHSAEWFNQQWHDDYWTEHGEDPNFADYVFRGKSMDAASRGADWSLPYWKKNYSHLWRNNTWSEQAKRDLDWINAKYSRPPERSYVVREPDGFSVTVIEYVGGFRVDFMKDSLGLPQAAVAWPGEIWSWGPLEYGGKLYRHERAHVEQMREMGLWNYKQKYEALWEWAMKKTRGNELEAWKIHPMEIDANRRAGLPDDWIQSGPADWRAP